MKTKLNFIEIIWTEYEHQNKITLRNASLKQVSNILQSIVDSDNENITPQFIMDKNGVDFKKIEDLAWEMYKSGIKIHWNKNTVSREEFSIYEDYDIFIDAAKKLLNKPK
jgi:hypothetical protein